jgi:carboxylesterase
VTEPSLIPGAEPFRFEGGSDGVLMVHGFSGSPASMRPMGEWFAAQGLTISAVRLPGHGTSIEDFKRHTWPEWASAVAEGLADLRSRCTRLVVLGQSMGGALAIHVAAGQPDDVDGLALCSPYLFDRRMALVPIGRLFMREVKGVGSDIKKEHVDETAYERLPFDAIVTMASFLKIARRDLPTVRTPALVFRPGEDHAIPKGNPERVYDGLASSRKELVDCPNSYHVVTLDNDAPMVQQRVLEFVRSL